MNFFVITLFGFFQIAVQASPLVAPRANLDVWSPTIISPNAFTVWYTGEYETVTWETSDAPQRISNRAAITLEGLDYPQRSLHPLVLAEGFNLTSGSQIIKVPDIIEPGKFRYRITLFGDSGNYSPYFTVFATVPGPSS